MAYLAPSEFVAKMVDAGESKVFMSTRDTIIRAYMAGAILALAADLAAARLWPQVQSMATPAMDGTDAGSWPLPPIMQHQCIR